jgi:hypothetical protein
MDNLLFGIRTPDTKVSRVPWVIRAVTSHSSVRLHVEFMLGQPWNPRSGERGIRARFAVEYASWPTEGLVPASLLSTIERFVCSPQPLLAVEREFSTGDPALIRTALFSLLHAGRVRAPELHTECLSLLTSFVAKEIES